MLAIRRTFEVITQESAEHGDVDRQGWTDAQGYEYASHPAAAPEPERVTFRDLLDLLEGTEPSCAPLAGVGRPVARVGHGDRRTTGSGLLRGRGGSA